jgi:hypothetical protein
VLLGSDVITTTTSLLNIDDVVKFLDVFLLLRLEFFLQDTGNASGQLNHAR